MNTDTKLTNNNKERINFVISNGFYIGNSVNYPICVQAESFEEMKTGLKELAEYIAKSLTVDEPFEYVKVESFQKYTNNIEEAAEKYCLKYGITREPFEDIYNSFIAGAEWQQSQLPEKAVPGRKVYDSVKEMFEDITKQEAIDQDKKGFTYPTQGIKPITPLQPKQEAIEDIELENKYMDGLTKNYGSGAPNKYQYIGKKCVTGCKNFTAYETKHHPNCPFYSNSLSEKYDKIEAALLSQQKPNTEKKVSERIAGYIHEIDSLREINRKLGEKIKEEKWISVEDRLPELPDDKPARVLAWAKGWFAPKIMYYMETPDGEPPENADEFDEGPWWVNWWHDEEICYEPSEEPLIKEDGDILPTYWQPLPAPPKK